MIGAGLVYSLDLAMRGVVIRRTKHNKKEVV